MLSAVSDNLGKAQVMIVVTGEMSTEIVYDVRIKYVSKCPKVRHNPNASGTAEQGNVTLPEH